MAVERSVTAVSHDLRHGENVWAVLCHAALRSIEWAADACGARDAGERIERTERAGQSVRCPRHRCERASVAPVAVSVRARPEPGHGV